MKSAAPRPLTELGTRFIKLDVRLEDDWRALAELVPTADVLVNNAGVTGFEDGPVAHDPEHARLADWHAVHRVNLDGTFLGCRYAIAAMKARGDGSIINISSRSGLVGIPLAAAYASSKAAVRNHSKTVALYCAQQGWRIRCNSIHPAAILTPIWEPMLGAGPDRAARMDSLVADTPLKRFGLPQEVAAVAAMLASDEANLHHRRRVQYRRRAARRLGCGPRLGQHRLFGARLRAYSCVPVVITSSSGIRWPMRMSGCSMISR